LSTYLRDGTLVEVASYKIYEYENADYTKPVPCKKRTDTIIYIGIKTGRELGLIANIGIGLAYALIYGIPLIGAD